MRKVLKWIGIVLAGLASLLVIALLVLLGLTSYRLNKVYKVTADPVAIPTDRESIERGRYIVTARSPCIGCHGPDLSGTFLLDDPNIGQIYSSNLTSGKGGAGAVFTDADWIRALRAGIDPEGKPLMVMPAQHIRYMSDADLGAVIAYLKSVPPVDRQSPDMKLTPIAKVLFALGQFGKLPAEIIAAEGPTPQPPDPGITIEYGEYIARVAVCRDCLGNELTGGVAGGPGGPKSPNLTQGGELLVWTDADFIKAFRTGETPSGHMLSADMPIKEYQMSDQDLSALFLYLKSLPAVQSGN